VYHRPTRQESGVRNQESGLGKASGIKSETFRLIARA
jgi:hypothetical protein